MKIKSICALALLASFASIPLFGETFVLFDGVKGKFKDGATPTGWFSYKAAGHSPIPQVACKEENGKYVWNITKVAGPNGGRYDSYRRYPAKAGDKFVVTVEAKGKGTGAFLLQANSEKGWEGPIGTKNFTVTDKYAAYKVEFDVKDLKRPTKTLFCHFWLAKGAELSIRSIKAEVIPAAKGK